jgi:hypothetical protein
MSHRPTYIEELGAPFEIVPWEFKGHPYAGRNANGYGGRIPADLGVVMGGRKYRVYVCIFSNIGTLYIRTKAHPFLVIPSYLMP